MAALNEEFEMLNDRLHWIDITDEDENSAFVKGNIRFESSSNFSSQIDTGKIISANQDPSLNNDANSIHRILKTDIKRLPKHQEDEIFFGCGCFWGAEKCFWKLPGVVTTSVGYAGGNKSNPTYYEVCSGLTGHSEVVRVIWNKSEIDISDLLKMFWECHDPTPVSYTHLTLPTNLSV